MLYKGEIRYVSDILLSVKEQGEYFNIRGKRKETGEEKTGNDEIILSHHHTILNVLNVRIHIIDLLFIEMNVIRKRGTKEYCKITGKYGLIDGKIGCTVRLADRKSRERVPQSLIILGYDFGKLNDEIRDSPRFEGYLTWKRL